VLFLGLFLGSEATTSNAGAALATTVGNEATALGTAKDELLALEVRPACDA
jgi:hypothetical protein